MANGIGAWKNFDDIEEYLILDELLLLSEQSNRNKKGWFRMMAAVQGVELNDDDEGIAIHSSADLPEELIAAEKEWRKKKEEHEGKPHNDFEDFGFGYSKNVK